jgi:hypothetical protein
MEPDIARLHVKLNELRRRDPQFRVFGAWRHRYVLNPCLSEQQVREVEARLGIALPDDYRRFLLFMGNGGAGPAYGLFSLEDSLAHSLEEVRLLREPFPHAKAWNLTQEELGLDRDRVPDYVAFDEAYFNDAYAKGALQICHEGCAYYFLLVVTGNERGYMWFDGRASDGGIFPLSAPPDNSDERLSFLAWYERWLDHALAGEPDA